MTDIDTGKWLYSICDEAYCLEEGYYYSLKVINVNDIPALDILKKALWKWQWYVVKCRIGVTKKHDERLLCLVIWRNILMWNVKMK